ncbi:MAG: hypothetical protein KIS66_11565 [Fimbriimonadaceae bacterium]|nr:hypothetical protein [Fimbriimonadaceae bacterium]
MARARWDRTKGRPEPIRALNRVIERDNGEPLVDLRKACPSVLILRPTVIPYLRAGVAAMLERAARALPDEYRIGVVDAWRPLARQQRIYDFFHECAREAWPDRTRGSIRRTILRWIAPTDQKAPPGHCTGGAVDVHLCDPAGEVVDVSAPYERFEAAATYAIGLTEEARRRRFLLVEAMLAAGFSNCRDEWWHYSFGDAGWAVRTEESVCTYGRIELPPALYAEQERLAEEAMKERVNPFLPGS